MLHGGKKWHIMVSPKEQSEKLAGKETMAETTDKETQDTHPAQACIDLFGKYRHKVDEKGRVSMPAAFRKVLSSDLVVTRSPYEDECLYVFEPEGFNNWIAKAFEDRFGSYDSTNRQHVKIRTMLKSRASLVSVDKVGRIMLPAELRQEAGIESDVVIIGNTGYFEIWDAKRFDAEDEEVDLSLLFG